MRAEPHDHRDRLFVPAVERQDRHLRIHHSVRLHAVDHETLGWRRSMAHGRRLQRGRGVMDGLSNPRDQEVEHLRIKMPHRDLLEEFLPVRARAGMGVRGGKQQGDGS